MASKKNQQLKHIIEAAIFVHEQPLSVEKLQATVLKEFALSTRAVRQLLKTIQSDYAASGIHLVEVGSGYRFQSDASLNPWISKLWQESAPKYSRALLEILSLIAYRQPITRGEIEDIRGVAVSSQIVKTLQEREWIKIVGHKAVPGRPALFATTKAFLDYFALASLADLPAVELPAPVAAGETADAANVAGAGQEMATPEPTADVETQLLEQPQRDGSKQQPRPATEPEQQQE